MSVDLTTYVLQVPPQLNSSSTTLCSLSLELNLRKLNSWIRAPFSTSRLIHSGNL
ncbi:hypothetical protein OSTOST_24843 [Ostertagia ostertagi]